MRVAVAIAVFQVLFVACNSVPLEEVRARDLAWLTGAWTGVTPTGQRIEELWSEPSEGTMTGEHRQIQDVAEVVFGSMRILSGAFGVVLLGTLEGETSRRYGLVEFGPRHALFRSREARYPSELEFERTGSRLTVKARGDDGLGKSREIVHDLQLTPAR